MIGLFKKQGKKEKIYRKYEILLDESHKLSKTNRSLSDQKYKQAQELLKQWEEMDE